MIRKLKTGEYRLYSRKKNPKTGRQRNLGTFSSKKDAQTHERAVQYFKHQDVEVFGVAANAGMSSQRECPCNRIGDTILFKQRQHFLEEGFLFFGYR